MVGDVQSGGKPRSGGSVGSWEEDGPGWAITGPGGLVGLKRVDGP
jgi:hypothetical protein